MLIIIVVHSSNISRHINNIKTIIESKKCFIQQ